MPPPIKPPRPLPKTTKTTTTTITLLIILSTFLLTDENLVDGLKPVRRKGIKVRLPGPVTCYKCESFYTGHCRDHPSKWWPCTGNFCLVLILDNSMSRYCHRNQEVEDECTNETKLVIKPGENYAACYCDTDYCNGFPQWEPYPIRNIIRSGGDPMTLLRTYFHNFIQLLLFTFLLQLILIDPT